MRPKELLLIGRLCRGSGLTVSTGLKRQPQKWYRETPQHVDVCGNESTVVREL